VDVKPAMSIESAEVQCATLERSWITIGFPDSITILATAPADKGRLVSQLIPLGLIPALLQ